MSISYKKTKWLDRIVQRVRTYTEQINDDGTVTHNPAPGTVIQEGTPRNAENMNKIEQGIEDCANAINEAENELADHINNRNNPHGVTAAMIGSINPTVGMYIGDGKTSRTIELGFKPKVVIYCDETSCFADDVKGTCGGILIRDYPQYAWSVGYNTSRSDTYKMAEIAEKGFTVYNNSSYKRYPNRNGTRYFYIAW